MTSDKPQEGLKSIKGMNINTLLLVFSLAAFGWASQLFVTKEIYYRDQVKLEQSMKDLNSKVENGQNAIIQILTRKEKP